MYIDTGCKPNEKVKDAIGAIAVTAKATIPPLYRARLWDVDTMTNDFVLCRNPDGVEGYYDLVTNTFHPIEGG